MVKSCQVLQIRAKNTRGIAQLGSEKQGANRASEAQFAHRTKRKKGKKKKIGDEKKKGGISSCCRSNRANATFSLEKLSAAGRTCSS